MGYLIENNQCERTFLAGLGWSWSCLAPILLSFGIHPHCCWALIEVDMKELAPSLKGDVDILIGGISWKDPQLFEHAVKEHFEMLKSYPTNALIQFMSPDNFVADQLTERGELIWPPQAGLHSCARSEMFTLEYRCKSLESACYSRRHEVDQILCTETAKGPVRNRKIESTGL